MLSVVEKKTDQVYRWLLAYIDETIYEPITIAEICQKFSMSRLQRLHG